MQADEDLPACWCIPPLRCGFNDNDLTDVHLLFTNEDDMWEAVPSAVLEMFTCMSKVVLLVAHVLLVLVCTCTVGTCLYFYCY